MRLVILGIGAIGGVIGGLLARAKRDVVLLARGAQLDAIRAGGLRVESPDATFTVHPEIADVRERFAWRAGDVLALAVKTQDAAAALRQIAMPRHVPILCLTNGVEAERIALRHVDQVYGGCVKMPATYLTPGVVQVWAAPVFGLIDVGRYPDGAGDLADEIAGELIASGFMSLVRPQIMKWKRAKLISNLANGAEALSGPEARKSDVADQARTEARACFSAAGLSCATEAEDQASREGYQSKPIAGATRSGGSTWQSLARGATELETDYLNGEIALLGRIHGVPTPVNNALQELAAEAVREKRAPGAMPLDELRARVTRSSNP